MVESEIGLVVALLLVAIPVVALAKRARISYPIVLVLAGLVLGFIPGLPKVRLDPDLVLLIFLPPLLYWGAVTAPTDVMMENAGQIGLLAVGLVIVTTVVVAVVVHAIIPGMPWGAAFVLGAIVSPTDELAAIPVLEHFRIPRYVLAIVEGESLLNDATALVIYATAVTIASTGIFHPANTLWQFIVTVVGSVAIGYLTGRLTVVLWRWIRDVQLQGVISIVTPFIAYLPAQYVHLSGVLAVVTAGVYVNRYAARVVLPAARNQVTGFWNTLVFVANAVLFLVVGLQLNDVARTTFRYNSWQLVLYYALVVNVVIIVVRLTLVVLAEYAPTAAPADHAAPNWKNALVVGWSGLRGAVSLAAALAIPLTLPNGSFFPHRDLIIFVTFTVILITLVGGGLTLPLVVSRLRIQGDTEERDEVLRALVRSSEAAIARITELEREGRIDSAHSENLRKQYEHRRDLQIKAAKGTDDAHVARHLDVEREILEAQRLAIIEMREQGEIDNVVMRRLLANIDTNALRSALPLKD